MQNSGPIAEWDSGSAIGTHFWVFSGLLANIVDTSGNNHIFQTANGLIVADALQHVALTYDPVSGKGVVYRNGIAVVTQTLGSFVAQTTYPMNIGRRTGNVNNSDLHYGGLIDELSLYQRALSSNEIAAIYLADRAGKCFTPIAPVITSQPQSITNLVGATAKFSVTVSATPLVTYRWSFNGTNLVGATNSTLTLANPQLAQAGNYSVVVSNYLGSTNSAVATLTLVTTPGITQQPQSQTVVSYAGASFTVAATGTPPLRFLWRRNGINLSDNGNITGSTTTNLMIASVNLTNAGNYSVVVSNLYGNASSAVAVLTVPQTGLGLGSGTAYSGTSIVVPVIMNALGVENTFLASVGYDPTKMVLQNVQLGSATVDGYLQELDTYTNSGLVGFAILLNSGRAVPAGTNQQVALLNFITLPVASLTTVNFFFTNSPTFKQIYDNDFNLLPALFTSGTIVLQPATYAADIFPRTNGDHQVNVQDWAEEGRMVVGLTAATNANELLRADCAPRNAPDGVLTVADWVQAGRYALGLDPLTLVAPPLAPSGLKSNLAFGPNGGPAPTPPPTRTLLVGSVTVQRGQTVNVPVALICTTNENAVGFTVSFNPAQLRVTGFALGSATAGGRTNINSSQPGKLGVLVALSPGAALNPGTNQLLILQFTASTNASGTATLTLDGTVAALQVADKTANALPANYVNGAVVLPPQPVVTASGAGAGAGLQLSWPINSGTFHVQTAYSPLGPWTTVVMPIITNGASATVMVSPTNQYQYFRLQGQ